MLETRSSRTTCEHNLYSTGDPRSQLAEGGYSAHLPGARAAESLRRQLEQEGSAGTERPLRGGRNIAQP